MLSVIWKDYRQGRSVFAVVSGVVLLPYVMLLGVALVEIARGRWDRLDGWDLLLAGAVWSIMLLALAAAFIAGNACAGERTDRSSEFLAYLPVSRVRIAVSRLVVAVATIALFLAVNLGIAAIAFGAVRTPAADTPTQVLANAIFTILLTFAAGWFWSTILRSSAIAAALGVASGMLVGGIVLILNLNMVGDGGAGWVEPAYRAICVVLGVLLLIAGTAVALLRSDP